MLPTKDTQHVAESLALLIEQFKAKTVIQGYLSTLARRVQDVENVLWDIIELRRLDVATGIQLDKLGALVGERRIGRSDVDYRTGIRIRIRVNRSKGRTVDVIDVASLAAGASPPKYIDYPFLGFEVDLFGQTGERYIADLLSHTRAATSYGILVASDLAASSLLIWDDAVSPGGVVTFSDAISGGLVCASAYGLPSDFTGIVLSATAVPGIPTVTTSGGAVGDIDGNYPATLTLTNATSATGVTFGGTPATSVVVVNATTITCVVPGHATGAVSVVVTGPGGSSPANTAFRYFSPAELALTAWWRASYPGTSWPATASAGVSSATGALVAGVSPSVGTALNGRTPATTNGTTQYLDNSTLLSTLFTSGAGSIVALCKPAAAVTAQAAGSEYLDPYCFGDGTNGGLGLSYSTGGFKAFIYDGAYKVAAKASAVGSWAAAFMRWDSTNVGITVNAAAEITTAAGAFSASMANSVRMGASYAASAFLQGDNQEVLCINSKLTAQNISDIRSYFNTRHFPAGAQV